MTEKWIQILYAPNYEISNLGNIKNIKTNKFITINYDRLKQTNSRARPMLSINSKTKGYYLHRIVAEHFIENSNKLPEVNHKDGDCYNNNSSNLEWISKEDNMKHASENNLMNRYKREIIIKNKITGEVNKFSKLKDCAKFLNCSNGTIHNTCSGKRIDKNYEIKYEKETKKIIDTKNIIWKPYPECDKYLVSNTGEIKNKKTDRLMMGSKQNGYRFVNLYIDNSTPKMNRLIHRMVAQTFLENVDKKPVVNHKDTNILNNHIDNLEWVTYKENMNTFETKQNLKKGKNSKIILQIEISNGQIINKFYGASEGHEQLNIDSNNILRICNYYKGNKQYGGSNTFKTYQKKYIFIFEEDKDNLETYLEIAKTEYIPKSIKVFQLDKNTKQLINTFNSCYEAARILNIKMVGINQCCQYYKYNDETRPKCYKLKSSHGFIFKQSI
jgi:hypothetical protein